MRRTIAAPFTSILFETTEAEHAGRGSLRLERGSGSFALSIQDRSAVAVEWVVRVQVKMADAGAGLVDLGTIHTVPPSKGSPPNRIVAFLSVPGAVAFMCDFQTATMGAQGTVGFGECPFIGEPGLVATQWALLGGDRFETTGGALAATFNGLVTVAPAAGLCRRVWSLSVWQAGSGCNISPVQAAGLPPIAPTIPIPPAGSLNLNLAGGRVLPVQFSVGVMGAQAGGWIIEWGE
jgi:hypothetical protein